MPSKPRHRKPSSPVSDVRDALRARGRRPAGRHRDATFDDVAARLQDSDWSLLDVLTGSRTEAAR